MFSSKHITIAACLILPFGTTLAAGDSAKGEEKASSCETCHGSDGKGAANNPAIAGLEEGYFIEQIIAFQTGKRDNPMMKMATQSLSEEDVANLAAFYSSQPK